VRSRERPARFFSAPATEATSALGVAYRGGLSLTSLAVSERDLEADGVLGRAIGREALETLKRPARINILTRDWLLKPIFGRIGWFL
jgi:hypothetical protein